MNQEHLLCSLVIPQPARGHTTVILLYKPGKLDRSTPLRSHHREGREFQFEPRSASHPSLGSTVAQQVRNPPAMQETQETWVPSLGWEDPLEEEEATHSSIFAWKMP